MLRDVIVTQVIISSVENKEKGGKASFKKTFWPYYYWQAKIENVTNLTKKGITTTYYIYFYVKG